MMYITRIKQYMKGRGMEAEMAGIGPEWLGAPSDRVSENKFETMMMCFSSMNPTLRKRIASGSTETSDNSSSVAPPSSLLAEACHAPLSTDGVFLTAGCQCAVRVCKTALHGRKQRSRDAILLLPLL